MRLVLSERQLASVSSWPDQRRRVRCDMNSSEGKQRFDRLSYYVLSIFHFGGYQTQQLAIHYQHPTSTELSRGEKRPSCSRLSATPRLTLITAVHCCSWAGNTSVCVSVACRPTAAPPRSPCQPRSDIATTTSSAIPPPLALPPLSHYPILSSHILASYTHWTTHQSPLIHSHTRAAVPCPLCSIHSTRSEGCGDSVGEDDQQCTDGLFLRIQKEPQTHSAVSNNQYTATTTAHTPNLTRPPATTLHQLLPTAADWL